MKALQYASFGGAIEIVERGLPRPGPGEAVVAVAASGLCRSDWHAWAGHDAGVHLPQVPGHECAGVVAEVGAGVARWQPGDRVTAPFVNGCGVCPWCRSGQAQVCPDQTQPGFTDPGTHAEFVTVRAADTNLVGLPDGLSFDAAASLGCRFATAHRALTRRAAVAPGEWVVIVGAGGVGLSAVMIAAALGARPIAVDRNPAALELATRVGAEAVVTAGPAALTQLIELTGGAHVSLDAVGSAATADLAVRSLRRQGRHVQVGLVAEDPVVPLSRVIGWELSLLGSHGMPAVDYPALFRLIEHGLDPAMLVSRTVGLAEAATLMRQPSGEGEAGIIVLHPNRA